MSEPRIERRPKVAAVVSRIAHWFCEDHPHAHLIFSRNAGRRRVRCRECEREAVAAGGARLASFVSTEHAR